MFGSKLLLAVAVVCLSAGSARAQREAPEAKNPAIRRGLPLTSFYDTPDPLPPGKAGDLIRKEPFDDYDLPVDASAVRILYHSVSAAGDDVASSGVVLLPEGTPPGGGWPIVAWAHAFLGTARVCAPSLMRGLRSGTLLSMYVNLGYAVVTTDYVGLGTRFRNAALDAGSNANDVIFAVAAARHAMPQLGQKWVAVGEAEGGATAIAVAELDPSLHGSGYLGSVAISGAADLKESIERISQGQRWDDRLAFLAYGIKTVYPQFELNEMFTPAGLERYQVATQACASTSAGPAPELSQTLKPGWQNNRLVRSFLDRNALGQKAARAPLMVISDENPKAPDAVAARLVSRMCALRDTVDFETYPDVSASEVIGASVAGQIAWIKARFAGMPAQNSCP